MSLTAGANSSHFGGALSIVEIVASIFCYMMKIDKKIHPGMKEIGLYLAKDTHV